jgi:hypothetical protein
MRWTAPGILSGVGSLFSSLSTESASAASSKNERIRQTMLAALGEDGCQEFPNLERRILFETNVQGLWYVRSELMAALSATHGEHEAKRQIDALTRMFRGSLPRGLSMNRRHSTLGAS